MIGRYPEYEHGLRVDMLVTQQQVIEQRGAYQQFNTAVFSDVSFGFVPAFKNLKDEQIHLSLDESGELALMHLLDHLPEHWVNERDELGKPLSLLPCIIAGFMRNSNFYTLSELMGSLRDS